MAVVLLFRGGGNWLPILFALIAALLIFEGIRWCIRYLITKIRHRKHIHHN